MSKEEINPNFSKLFQTATEHPPYDYQIRLACGERSERSDDDWLRSTADCESKLISIPTGLGKTAAVVLAWLWNRVIKENDNWPRRLVYCLPMRTLVEQTEGEISKWLTNIISKADELGLDEATLAKISRLIEYSPVILMGGEDNDEKRREWDIYPEEPCILIGTQDMLLSRALNRGYGMSRARWPMHFGLLNNDCLWVLDETQLMGPALWTSSQLDWLRQDRFLRLKNCSTWWMSATIGTAFLKTLDRTNSKTLKAPSIVSIENDDLAVIPLFKATRHVSIWKQPPTGKAPNSRKKSSAKTEPLDLYLNDLINAVLQEHQTGTLSLVVCNKVVTAQKLFQLLEASASESTLSDPRALLTSRFRIKDRNNHLEKLLAYERARKSSRSYSANNTPHPGLICVSTQIIEAGIDVSARRLWSELAPWPSTLQRLGRLNRDGFLNLEAKALIFEVPSASKKSSKATTQSGPYDPAEIKKSRTIISALESACAKAADDTPIRQIYEELQSDKSLASLIKQSLEPRPAPFPRAIDVHGLFSNEPDAFGGFTDVSPWVRSSDPNADLTVFWRDWPQANVEPNDYDGPGFQRDEGCPVAIHRIRSFIETNRQAWKWDDKSHCWVRIPAYEICPGMTLLLPSSAGGYDRKLGWTADRKHSLHNLPPPGPFDKRTSEDAPTQARGHWVSLNTHLTAVASSMKSIAETLELPVPLISALHHAAALHDIGKSVEPWQNALPCPKPHSPASSSELWAKAPFLLKLEIDPIRRSDTRELLSIITSEAPSSVLVQVESKDEDQEMLLRIQIDRRMSATTIDTLAAHPSVKRRPRIERFAPGLRHEAASALATWHRYYHAKTAEFSALTIYLIASHHGLVRTVLTSRDRVGQPNICGVPVASPDPSLPWNPDWKLDFKCARDGSSGEFSEDGLGFIANTPGWTGLVADLLGGWEADAPEVASGAIPEDEPHTLNPFNLAYLEALLRGADGRTSATEQGLSPAQADLNPLPQFP